MSACMASSSGPAHPAPRVTTAATLVAAANLAILVFTLRNSFWYPAKRSAPVTRLRLAAGPTSRGPYTIIPTAR